MNYSQPTELPEALSLLAQPGTRVVAGGTDIYPSTPAWQHPNTYLDVTRINALSRIGKGDTFTRLGAAATWSDVVRADLPPAFDALKEAAREVGSLQIQNAGTIAGNICNASPAADGVPPLLALDAQIEVMSAARGIRTLPFSGFITGIRQTALQPDEMVTAILVPNMPSDMVSAFEKLGSRRYLVISIAMTAVNIVLDDKDRIATARVAVGSCSAVAQRLNGLEGDMIGQYPAEVEITPDHLEQLSPIDDVRGTADFRLQAAAQQIRRAIGKAVRA